MQRTFCEEDLEEEIGRHVIQSDMLLKSKVQIAVARLLETVSRH